MTLIFFLCVSLGVFFCFRAYIKMAMTPIKVISKDKKEVEKDLGEAVQDKVKSIVPVEKKAEKTEEIKVKLRTDKMIKYSNGFSVRVGESYKGYKIEKIDKDFVHCLDANGKRFKVGHIGLIQ